MFSYVCWALYTFVRRYYPLFFVCVKGRFTNFCFSYFYTSSSDKDEQDGEGVSSMLGFQSYWDAAYADELANFREHGHTGEVWYGLSRRLLAIFSLFIDPLRYYTISLWHYLFYPSIPNKVGLIYESLEAILCRLNQIIPILCYIKQLWMLKQIRNSPSLRFCKSHFILQWHTCLSLNPVFFFADSREYHI